MGIKLFVIDYVYYKFPKVKRKYDSVYKLWKSLPTRQEWEWTHVQSHIDDVSYLITSSFYLLWNMLGKNAKHFKIWKKS